ncbi:MAG: gliding motility protein GldM [Bacteroidales bacterium]|jgi:gliding motility-associated protein GldM|nr:gliding motility protein GldM [Bacteroidales bacterium]
MAKGKETPRQKMIGMMYLILTAMLALNVSKEAVDAFAKVEKGLEKTLANYEQKNNEIYEEFDRAAAENEEKAGEWRRKAYEVKQRADEIYEYVQDLKIEIITKADGADTDGLDGRRVVIDSVKKYDENNVPSEVLIGANHDQKAYALRALIDEYRTWLIDDIIQGANISVEHSIMETLSTEPGLAPDGSVEQWEENTLAELPLIAAIVMLSKIQVDIRNSETDVIMFLNDQITAGDFKFTDIEATVLANSSYVMRGSTYEAEVFIAASDTTKQPDILVGDYRETINADGSKSYEMVGDYTKLEVNERGRGIFRTTASTIGPKTYRGLIKLQAPDGSEVAYPFEESYNVGAPNVIVSPTAMNVLYVGIDNPIDISVPGYASNLIQASMSNGTIRRGRVEGYRGEWAARPQNIGQAASINVSVNVEGERMSFPPYEFRVQRIPDPVAKFAGMTEGTVDKNVALAQPGVFAVLENFLFDLEYRVTQFTVSVQQRGFDRSETSNSARLTQEQRALIESLNRGQKLNIINIRAVAPDESTRRLPPIILTIN